MRSFVRERRPECMEKRMARFIQGTGQKPVRRARDAVGGRAHASCSIGV